MSFRCFHKLCQCHEQTKKDKCDHWRYDARNDARSRAADERARMIRILLFTDEQVPRSDRLRTLHKECGDLLNDLVRSNDKRQRRWPMSFDTIPRHGPNHPTTKRADQTKKETPMKYRHELAEEFLKQLPATAPEHEIAAAIAYYFIANHGGAPQIVLTINHNAKAARCPVRIDKPGIKRSSFTARVKDAHSWIVGALLRGYEVTAVTTRHGPVTKSIASVKRSLEFEEKMKLYRAGHQGVDDGDDIPF